MEKVEEQIRALTLIEKKNASKQKKV